MESVKTNDEELTSTMGGLLSTSKDEKNDASDSTPTSSTDAFTTTSTSHIAADDPISSTSSDVSESRRTNKANDTAQSSSSTVKSSPRKSVFNDISVGDHTSIVSEKDLLVMNITDTSIEKITENVDDIVQDLENLLGEPTTTFDFTVRPKSSSSFTSASHHKDIPMDLDEFSMEFHIPGDKPNEPEVKDPQKEQHEDVNKVVLQEVHETPCVSDDSVNQSENAVDVQNNSEIPKSDDNGVTEISASNSDEREPETIGTQETENSECEANSAEIIQETKQEGSEVQNPDNTDITSTDSNEISTVDRQEQSESDSTSNIHNVEVENRSENVSCDIPEAKQNEEMGQSEHEESFSRNTGIDSDLSQIATLEEAKEEKHEDRELTQLPSTVEDHPTQSPLNKPQDERAVQKEKESEDQPILSSLNEPQDEREVEKEKESEELMHLNRSQESIVEEKQDQALDSVQEGGKIEDLSSLDTCRGQIEETKDQEDNLTHSNSKQCEEAEEKVLSQPSSGEVADSVENIVGDVENIPTVGAVSSNIEGAVEINENDSCVDEQKSKIEKEDHNEKSEELVTSQSIDNEETEMNEGLEEVRQSESQVEQDANLPLVEEDQEANIEAIDKRVADVPDKDTVDTSETVEQNDEKTDANEPKEESDVNIPDESDEVTEIENTHDRDQISPSGQELPHDSTVTDECQIIPTAVDETLCQDAIIVPEPTEQATPIPVTESHSAVIEAPEDPEETEWGTQIPVIEEAISESTEAPTVPEETELVPSIPFIEDGTSELVEAPTVPDETELATPIPDAETPSEPPTVPEEIELVTKNPVLEEAISGLVEIPTVPEETELVIPIPVEGANTQVTEAPAEEPEISEAIINKEEFATMEVKFPDVTEVLSEIPVPKETTESMEVLDDTLDIFDTSPVLTEAVESTVDDGMEVPPIESFDTSTALPEDDDEGVAEVPSSSIKNLEESVIENSILPLVMEDVPDIDVLNAISTLQDDKQDLLLPEMTDNLESSDTLLASNSLTNENFEPIESSLPTVDEIFAEQSEQQVELPDDNLETLLAVASLQGVCETDSVYNEPVEDLSSYVQEVEQMKIQDEKIESLFEDKEIVEQSSMEDAVETGAQTQEKLKEPLVINVGSSEKDRAYSPKIIIKPIKPAEEEITSASGEQDEKENCKGSLKMTITKQSDTMHSILKIYDPDDDSSQNQDTEAEPTVPKLIIKPIVQPNEQPHSPKMSTRSSKQVFSPSSSASQRSASPRITIKPIVKPEPEPVGPVKITIKPVLKPEESHRQKHSPKLTIKPIIKPDEGDVPEGKVHSPRVTIKPIVKPPDEEQAPSPRITIKPIVKPESGAESVPSTPRVTIKPVVKPDKPVESPEPMERSSPKITIKPIVKPQEPEVHMEDFEESIKERIVLKINKGTIPSSSKESRKRDMPQDEEKSEKLAKIKLKFSKEGGHPHIVQDESPSKRSLDQDHDRPKRQRIDTECLLPGVTITPISPAHSKLKEMLSGGRGGSVCDKVVTVDDDDDDVTIVEDPIVNKSSPIVISEESNQDSVNLAGEARDPISDIPVFEITPDSVKTINLQAAPPVVEAPVALPAPRKRGRPRKVPLQVREDFKDPKEEEPKPVVESTRPKRSCRGQSVRTTLGIKPRKPRGPGRGRGSKRGMGTRSTPTPPESPPKPAKEPKLSAAKLKQLKEELVVVTDKTEVKHIEIDDGFHKSPSQSLLAPPHSDNSTTDRADIVMYEEETRMSAETSSRAQTPAKQVVSSTPTVDLVEESQSSVQSTATTESAKVRKGPRLEVHQEPEGAVISADQLAEYYWNSGGPFMLQEQVAQFLGIKSFKRKYPNIPRRVVDMQERDFIRESGLAGEAMCDLGLTAVNSSDILDIMYSDFQDKYEEYCKHLRDRQAKDLTNKQKALTLAASQEKTKMDITQQAVQSAASWNATFNKARRDQRKACMDLQTLTVHYPKGKMKQINKLKIGHYPVALVPGQFTDFYAEYTPTEINNLPLNTLCYDTVIRGTVQEMECDSQTDGSGSESDTSTSDSDSSYSGSSDAEDCTLCNKSPMKRVAAAQ